MLLTTSNSKLQNFGNFELGIQYLSKYLTYIMMFHTKKSLQLIKQKDFVVKNILCSSFSVLKFSLNI